MAATYMLRKHQAAMASAARPEAVQERAISAEAWRRAGEDRRERFPTLSAHNAEEAAAFQSERAAYWTTVLSA